MSSADPDIDDQGRADMESFMPQLLIEQAEICIRNARDAEKVGRYGAASGLFITAAALLRHVTQKNAHPTSEEVLLARLHDSEREASRCANMARRLHSL